MLDGICTQLCEPSYRLLTLRGVPQSPTAAQTDLGLTSASWPALLRRLTQMQGDNRAVANMLVLR